MRPKFKEVAKVVSRRIQRGDYSSGGFPGEMKLAEELGVSYMTARRAILLLIEQGQLSRTTKGRTQVIETGGMEESRNIQIALLVPADWSAVMWDWHSAIVTAVGNRGLVRLVPYLDYDDRGFSETLTGAFDGVFLLLQPDPPALALDLIKAQREKLVAISDDYTEMGIPSVDHAPEQGISILMRYLKSLGHRRVDCFSANAPTMTVKQNIQRWKANLDLLKLEGELFDWYNGADSAATAYDGFSRLLDRGMHLGTAAFMSTMGIAPGIYRAAHEHRIVIGQDLSLCSFGAEIHAKLMVPSLTCTGSPDRVPYVRRALDWMLGGARNWKGSLVIKPTSAPLFVGESSGPAPSTVG